MEFKDRIKNLRLKKNLSQAQLANDVNKGESAIRAWESGRAKPDADTLMFLASYFDCSIDYLMGRSNYRSNSEAKIVKSQTERLIENLLELESETGHSYIKCFQKFIQLALDRKHAFVASTYLISANQLYFALDQLYRLEDEFSEKEKFDMVQFLDCYANISRTISMVNTNMQLISSYPLPWIIKCAENFGDDTDVALMKKFFSLYHTGSMERSSENDWPDILKKLFAVQLEGDTTLNTTD